MAFSPGRTSGDPDSEITPLLQQTCSELESFEKNAPLSKAVPMSFVRIMGPGRGRLMDGKGMRSFCSVNIFVSNSSLT